MFSIDPQKFRVIDISHTVIPGQNPERPFAIQRALLQDLTFRYDILKTHSHVGTHVEVAAHFFDGGRSITDYPPESFYGRGILLSVTETVVDAQALEKKLGKLCTPGDIVVARNDTGIRVTKEEMYLAEQENARPTFVPEAARWLAERRIKMLVLGAVRMGRNLQEGRQFHDILMGQGCTFLEIVENLAQITRPEFFLMALPYKVQGLDSSFARAIVIEEI